MKYQQPENKTLTSCKDCVLAVYDGNTQTSCLANRINKIDHIEAYDDDKEFFVVERFCNYYRNKDGDFYINNGKPDIDKIRSESYVTFNLMILCNHIDQEYYDYILNLYNEINKSYDKNKIDIHFLYTIASREQVNLIKDLRSLTQNSFVTFYGDKTFWHNTLIRSTKSYHLVIDKDSRVDLSICQDINNLINEEMLKLIVIKNNDTYAISNLAYKITSLQTESYDYDNIVSNIIEQSKEKNLYYE